MPKMKLGIDSSEVTKAGERFKKMGNEVDGVEKKTTKLGGSFKKLGGLIKGAIAGSATLLAMKELSKVVDSVNKNMETGAAKAFSYSNSLKGLYALAGQSGVERGKKLAEELADRGISPQQTLEGLQSTISGASSLSADQQDEIMKVAGIQVEAGVDGGAAGGFDIMRGLITKLVATNPETFKGKEGVKAAGNFAQKLIKESGVLASDAKAGIKAISAAESTGVSASNLGGTFAVLTQNKVSAEESATAIETLAFKYAEYTDKGGKLGWNDWIKAMSVLPKAEQKRLLGDIGGRVIGILGKRTSQISQVSKGLDASIDKGNAGRLTATTTLSELTTQNQSILVSNIKDKIAARKELQKSGLNATITQTMNEIQDEIQDKNRGMIGSEVMGAAVAGISTLTGGAGYDSAMAKGYDERGDELYDEVKDLRKLKQELNNVSNNNLNNTLKSMNATNKKKDIQGGKL